ncbi:hypothetical protein BH10BDE1_BH10BDE1_08680 [soil metagenome]
MFHHFRVRFAAILMVLLASVAVHAGSSAPSYPAGQMALIQTQEAHKGANFIEVADVTVTQLLPDDTFGSRHQKWVVQLSNGREVACVYNIDVTPKIPLKVGDIISLGGQFIYDRDGGLLHWLHEDGRGHRPNGYVELEGVRYGANGGSGIYTK